VHAISGVAFMNGDWEKSSTYVMLDVMNTIRVTKRGYQGGVALKKPQDVLKSSFCNFIVNSCFNSMVQSLTQVLTL